jgi:chromosome segregation ATPase
LTDAPQEGIDRGSRNPKRGGNDRAYDRPLQGPLINALEAHVETLKEQLAAAEARIAKQADELVGYDTAYAAGLAAEKAKVEAERAKGERMIAEFAARDAQSTADLKAEQARTEKAIAAFASLAERLDALAAERAKPWWRRLAG